METEATIKLHQAISDISYIAGRNNYYSGDSRADINHFIYWAKEFEKLHAQTDWNENDYMIMIEEYTLAKISERVEFN
jgi:hypothetical protein